MYMHMLKWNYKGRHPFICEHAEVFLLVIGLADSRVCVRTSGCICNFALVPDPHPVRGGLLSVCASGGVRMR